MDFNKLNPAIAGIAFLAFFLLLFQQSSFAAPYFPAIQKINFAILIIFSIDVLVRFVFASHKLKHLKLKWFDLIVFVPFVQYLSGVEHYSSSVIMQQAVIVVILLSRIRKTNKLIATLGLKPAQLMITSFLLAICMGSILLTLPMATRSGIRTPLIDAFFTATSAICVTGLVVKDTATHFSLFGQIVILGLIQVGGLGIMTFSVFLALLSGKRMELRQRIIMHDVLDQDALTGAVQLIFFIMRMTVIIELAGAVALTIVWYHRFPFVKSCYYALFHSISAFCNAGFSTFSDSLMGFSDDIATNVIICILIILGGLGFIVIKDIFEQFQKKMAGSRKKTFGLKVHTRLVLTISFLLIVIGALGFFALEDSIGLSLPGMKKDVLIAVFQSISARTAGFNSCDMARLSHATLFFMIMLMFIGASPGSTGGGIKTTTFAVLWASMVNGFSQNDQVEIYRRTIPEETIQKALTVFLFYFVLLFPAVLVLLAVENTHLMYILFESVSAIATVGLSTGITAGLSFVGKIVIITLMFIGRLGPLTLGYAFVLSRKKSNYSYAEERVMIG